MTDEFMVVSFVERINELFIINEIEKNLTKRYRIRFAFHFNQYLLKDSTAQPGQFFHQIPYFR